MQSIDVVYLAYGLLTLVGAAIHLAVSKRPRSTRRVVEVLLLWTLLINVGVGGLMGFYAHSARAAQTAAEIGWPPGSPFQFEVAVANLAFGVLGLLCLRLRGLFWWATAIGIGIFLLGAAYGHVQQMVTAQNYAPGNAGVVF